MLLSRRSPWRRSLPSATVATPFGRSRLSSSLRAASVRLGLDFARYLCHEYQTVPFSSRAKPGTQQWDELGFEKAGAFSNAPVIPVISFQNTVMNCHF